MEPLPTFTPGVVIGGAVLGGRIEIGGQAEVFHASYMGRPAAVKIVKPVGEPGEIQKALERFDREQDMLLTLQHPNIVTVYAAGIAKVRERDRVHAIPYIIMELMSRSADPPSGKPMPWKEVVRIALDAAQGLNAAHERGIVHRDIKPRNILLTETGVAKISDFGLARLLASGVFSGGGTPAYVSPEQYDPTLVPRDDTPAAQPDALSDIYSLGVTLYHMLTGRLPYDVLSLGAYLRGAIPPLPLSAQVPAQLQKLVCNMMSLRRDGRPRSLSVVLGVLEDLQFQGSPVQLVKTVPLAKDLSDEETSLERYVRAFLRPAFFEKIYSLKGQNLGGWKALGLYAIGGEGILLRVARSGQEGILKMPNLPYDRPADFGTKEINRLREELVFEADMLRRFSNTLMPKLLDLAEGHNPLMTDRSPRVANVEKFLVMEFIPGRALDLEIQARLKQKGAEEPEVWLQEWIPKILRFLSQLKAVLPGYYYTDFKPSNVRISPDGQVHLLDGGSITWPGAIRNIMVTPGYCLPRLLKSSMMGADLEAVSLFALGRTVYSSLLNRVLYEGVQLDFKGLIATCGARWARWIEQTSTGRWRTFAQARPYNPGT